MKSISFVGNVVLDLDPEAPYRGLAATANHFARESHIDELAHAVNMIHSNFV